MDNPLLLSDMAVRGILESCIAEGLVQGPQFCTPCQSMRLLKTDEDARFAYDVATMGNVNRANASLGVEEGVGYFVPRSVLEGLDPLSYQAASPMQVHRYVHFCLTAAVIGKTVYGDFVHYVTAKARARQRPVDGAGAKDAFTMVNEDAQADQECVGAIVMLLPAPSLRRDTMEFFVEGRIKLKYMSLEEQVWLRVL
jgi:hypothetical protein